MKGGYTVKRTVRRKRIRKRRVGLLLIVALLLAFGFKGYIFANGKPSLHKTSAEEETEFNGSDEQVDNTNVLILGSDARGDERARADTIMIANYSSNTKQPKIVSIMRDTYVHIPEHGYNKINAAYAFGGAELMRQTIEENFGIPIHSYAEVNFNSFEEIVDAVAPDGIEVTPTYEMTQDKKALGVQLTEGTQKLHGKELLAYSRFRHDGNGDYGRVERQQEVFGKLKEEVSSFSTITKLPKIVRIAYNSVDTNVPYRTLLSVGTDVVRGKTKDVETMRLPMDDTYHNTRYDVGAVLEFDEGGLEENAAEVQAFLEES
ncbi:hypothetical protein VL03_09745 [Rossellomorea marisflavi]|nr:hypothetical protein VL03_09745 [Rossellomorea marisflavi]